jgi:putative transposase
VTGRKRHVLVDTQGFLLTVVVSAANVQDRDGGRLVCAAQRTFGPALPRLKKVWADAAYSGALVEWVAQQLGWEVEIVTRPADQQGFVVQAKRWIVERTFAWWQGYRRLAKDYEYQLESSEALIYAAMSQLLTRRLARLLTPSPG